MQPTEDAPQAVFAGLPIEMVWSYFPTESPLEFIQDPADGLWNVDGWNVYLPASVPDAAVLTTLFAVQANRSYLIKIGGASPVQLQVTGTIKYKEIDWQPDGFTLTGLKVDPSTTVRSGDYFANSSAHRGKPRFRLDQGGKWFPMSDNTIVKKGVAYWVFSDGGSSYTGPLQLEFGGGDRMDYGQDIQAKRFTIRNRSASGIEVSLGNSGGFPLVLQRYDSANGRIEWDPLTTLTQTVPAEGSIVLVLGILRNGMPAYQEEILSVSGEGFLRKVVVSAENPVAELSASPYTGLWFGSITLKEVSEPNTLPTEITYATPAEFTMRIILHVDAGGATRLLKEVIVMKRPNAGDPAAAGELVILSDAALIPQFQAPGSRDGSPFAPRVSTVGFDFEGTELPLSGGFGSGLLTGMVVVGRDLPTNPFKHRYHPDHDDLTPSYQSPPEGLPEHQQEVWAVTRDIELDFGLPAPGGSPTSIPGSGLPADGLGVLEGAYTETVTGLHKNPIVTAGEFRLRRVNLTEEINPAP